MESNTHGLNHQVEAGSRGLGSIGQQGPLQVQVTAQQHNQIHPPMVGIGIGFRYQQSVFHHITKVK